MTSVFDQWRDVRDHCEDQSGWEHHVLGHMLRQIRCVHDGCSYRGFIQPDRMRSLFDHEVSMHNGATSMWRVEPFVVLARQRRVTMRHLYAVKNTIFERMVDKMNPIGNTIILMFPSAGFPHSSDWTPANLRSILSPSHLRLGGSETLLWEPLPSGLFLLNIAPRADAPANDLRRLLWTRLRLLCAEGRIR